MTVFQYMKQYRINKSIDLLLQSDLSIINIAMQCGFDNLSYYIRTFKELTGLTPNNTADSTHSRKSHEAAGFLRSVFKLKTWFFCEMERASAQSFMN